MKWARTSAGLSHDRLVAAMGRSNRGHVIKVERGDHVPRPDLRAAWADATNVPRELFESEDEDEESDPVSVFLADLLIPQLHKRGFVMVDRRKVAR